MTPVRLHLWRWHAALPRSPLIRTCFALTSTELWKRLLSVKIKYELKHVGHAFDSAVVWELFESFDFVDSLPGQAANRHCETAPPCWFTGMRLSWVALLSVIDDLVGKRSRASISVLSLAKVWQTRQETSDFSTQQQIVSHKPLIFPTVLLVPTVAKYKLAFQSVNQLEQAVKLSRKITIARCFPRAEVLFPTWTVCATYDAVPGDSPGLSAQ